MTDLSQLTDAQLQALMSQSGSATAPPVLPVQSRQLPPLQGTNSFGLPLAGSNYILDPSKLSDQQLLAAAANANPNMSGAEDFGRSVVTGLEKGVAGVAGLPGDIRRLEGGAVNFTARQVARAMGHDPGAGNVFDPKAVGPTDILNPAMLAAHMAPTTGGLDAAQQAHLGPYHIPQTTAGRYGQRIAEFAPTVVGGEASIPAKLLATLLAGGGSQAAEDIAPEQFKPAAAMGGALLGGLGAGGLAHLGRAPEAAFGNALGNVSPEQMRLSEQLRQSAAASGLKLTVPEAVQQVTDNGTGLGRMQRVVESTKPGQALTAPYFAERPAQVQGAVSRFADQIAGPSNQPGMIGQRANAAASGALDKARQTVNKVAEPDYRALTEQQMDPEQYAQLTANPSYLGALKELRSHPELGATVAHLPDSNLSVINEVQKRLGTGADAAAGSPLLPGDNHLAALRTQAKTLADMLARDASDTGYGGEYGRARDTVSNLSAQYVDPLKAGPLGAMSKTAKVGEQTAALYPAKPLEGASNETGQAVRVLGATDPGVAEDLTRQHLVNALNDAMKNLQGGQNQYAGAKLAVSLAGNPEQAATLHAGVSALPGGEQRAQEMADLLQALQATGKRQQPGSMTAFNADDLKDLHIAPFAHALGRIGDPLTWGAGVGDVINRANYRRNVNSLAEMLMADPEKTVSVLERAKKAAKPGVNPLLPALLSRSGND